MRRKAVCAWNPSGPPSNPLNYSSNLFPCMLLPHLQADDRVNCRHLCTSFLLFYHDLRRGNEATTFNLIFILGFTCYLLCLQLPWYLWYLHSAIKLILSPAPSTVLISQWLLSLEVVSKCRSDPSGMFTCSFLSTGLIPVSVFQWTASGWSYSSSLQSKSQALRFVWMFLFV